VKSDIERQQLCLKSKNKKFKPTAKDEKVMSAYKRRKALQKS
jgi:hypothetical protein